MALVTIQDKYLTDIADAIRKQNGTDTAYKPKEMADAINNISSSKSLDTKGNPLTLAAFLTQTNLAILDEPELEAIGSCGNQLFLTSVKLPSCKFVYQEAFKNCPELTRVELSANCGQIGKMAFMNCEALETLIIRDPVPPLTGSNLSMLDAHVFDGTPIQGSTGYIYVPRAAVSDYQNHASWSYFRGSFRAIEDYPDICG